MISHSQQYVLDANVFIEASRRYYPLDFAKPFWDGLIDYSQKGYICSIDKVYNEIKNGNDALKDWAENNYFEFFVSTKEKDIIQAYSDIVLWVQSRTQFNQTAKDIFMQSENADTWVLSFALAKNYMIVTHEAHDENIKKRVPIPNVANAFGIKCYNTFEMLRELKFAF